MPRKITFFQYRGAVISFWTMAQNSFLLPKIIMEWHTHSGAPLWHLVKNWLSLIWIEIVLCCRENFPELKTFWILHLSQSWEKLWNFEVRRLRIFELWRVLLLNQPLRWDGQKMATSGHYLCLIALKMLLKDDHAPNESYETYQSVVNRFSDFCWPFLWLSVTVSKFRVKSFQFSWYLGSKVKNHQESLSLKWFFNMLNMF